MSSPMEYKPPVCGIDGEDGLSAVARPYLASSTSLAGDFTGTWPLQAAPKGHDDRRPLR